ncbi:MAG: hypothetical protein KM296_04775 [Brockia lithotrophica]|nr:hypothetical protein [Brockia lithotrophica]
MGFVSGGVGAGRQPLVKVAPRQESPVCEEDGPLLLFRGEITWTDAHAYHAHGLYTVVWGPGRLDVAHTAREFVDRAALERAYRFLLAVLSHPWG